MDNELNKKQQGPKQEVQNDMLMLIQKFQIAKLNYVDVAQQERVKKIINHWPLVKELSEQ